MHILFLISHYPGYGGIEKVTTYIASFLVEKGIEVSILSYGTNISDYKFTLDKRIHLKFVPKNLDYSCNENILYIYNFLTNNNVDYIIFQDSYAPIEHIFTDVDYPWNKKLIVVEHNTPLYSLKTVNSYFYYNKGLSFFLQRLIRYPASIIKAFVKSSRRHLFLLEKCYKYVVLADCYKKEIKYICNNKYLDKIITISNPLTIPNPSTLDFLHKKKKQILFVGRLTNQKGTGFLLSIWKEFSKNNTNDWELVILGAGNERIDIEQEIMRKGLNHIRIDNPTTEISTYYEQSAILVMTSIYEGFPLVLAESMSRGCVPIAFSSFSSIHDIIDDGENGLLVTPFDVKTYSKKLLALTKNEQILNNMAENAIKSANKFDLNTIGNRWIDIFNKK